MGNSEDKGKEKAVKEKKFIERVKEEIAGLFWLEWVDL
jgi:hypothetical protein